MVRLHGWVTAAKKMIANLAMLSTVSVKSQRRMHHESALSNQFHRGSLDAATIPWLFSRRHRELSNAAVIALGLPTVDNWKANR